MLSERRSVKLISPYLPGVRKQELKRARIIMEINNSFIFFIDIG
jgi:hypothetical protein